MAEHQGKEALRRMVETASKATPGPWESDITQGGIGGQVCRNECVVAARDLVCFLVARRGTQTGRQWAHDGNHIAAANPSAVQSVAAYVAELVMLLKQAQSHIRYAMANSTVTTSDNPGCFWCDTAGHHAGCATVQLNARIDAALTEVNP